MEKKSFIEEMENKYNHLFRDGELEYLSDCPVGWEPIVDRLLFLISEYQDFPVTFKKKSGIGGFVLCCVYKTFSAINKLNHYLFSPHFNKGFQTAEDFVKARKGLRGKIFKLIQGICLTVTTKFFCYELETKDPVYVMQITGIHGVLLVYVDGVDDYIEGLLRYAEALSIETDPETGLLKEKDEIDIDKVAGSRHNSFELLN